MFEYIHGKLVTADDHSAVVDVNGVGYALAISSNTFRSLNPTGQSQCFFTHLSIREDAHKLYGFSTKEERDIFRLLIQVNMVGPKLAITLLCGMTVLELIDAIQTQNISAFKKISGVGPKTAERIVLELRGKLESFAQMHESILHKGRVVPLREKHPWSHDVHDALIALGYSELQVKGALVRVTEVIEPDASIEQWVKKALKVIA